MTERTAVRERAPEPAVPSGGAAAVLRIVRGPRALARWAVASLVVNVVIVVTGALVRLTSSGLGCPTWPRCTADSYTTHPALGLHGAIEFGNRLLTFVLVVVAVLTWVAALLYRDALRRNTQHRDTQHRDARGGRRRDLRWIAGGLALGIPAQAVIGGISVLTQLNPFVVGLHLLVSMVLIALSVWLVRRTRGLTARPAGRWPTLAARTTFVVMWLALWLGTIVTGSGPHAGDEHVARTGLDGALVTHLHAAAVYVVVVTTLLSVWLLRSRASVLLLAVVVGQAVVGISQYALGLPVGLVMLHLLGASLATAASTNLFLSVTPTSAASRSGTEPARSALS